MSAFDDVCTVAVCITSVVLLAKVTAYGRELVWQLRFAPAMRWEWAHRDRTVVVKDAAGRGRTLTDREQYELLQRHAGRPRPVFAWIEARSWPGVVKSLVKAVWLSPVLMTLASTLLLLASRKGTNETALDVAAVVLSATAGVVLLTSLAGRVLVGNLDSLNPDLDPPGPLKKVAAANMSSYRLVVYFVVLAFIAVVSGAASTAAVANAHLGAFTGGHHLHTSLVHDVDPIPYLYFSVVTIATVGYGDIAPASDLARAITLEHIATGPILFTWLVAVFTSSSTTEVDPSSVELPPAFPIDDCQGHPADDCAWRALRPASSRAED